MNKRLIDRRTRTLLLSLMTVFMMVVGAYGMAINMSQVPSNDGAANEPGSGPRDIEKTPIHAEDEGTYADGDGGDLPVDMQNSAAMVERTFPKWTDDFEQSDEVNVLRIEDVETTGPAARIQNMPTAGNGSPRTMNAPAPPTTMATVDAGGPYGDKDNPYFEGDDVDFDATLSGGNAGDYYFRWNVDADPDWDVNHFPPAYGGDDMKGVSSHTEHYTDNHIGEGLVEAWDGISLSTFSGSGDIWGNSYPPSWYMYQGYEASHGIKFHTTQTITIDQIGAVDYYYPYGYYNARLWTASGSLLTEVLYPSSIDYQWNWWSVPVVTIPPGDYVVSVGIWGYYQTGEENPGPTADGIIDPMEWVYGYYDPWGFPAAVYGDTPLPLIDFHYTYSYLVPAVISDTAEVYVDNVAPVVESAWADPTEGDEGSEIEFYGSFSDVGVDDDWESRVCFGDGECSPWKKVVKYDGGAKILFLTSWTYDDADIIEALDEEMGNFDVLIDLFDWGPLGENEAPSLELLMEYDVVIAAENYISTPQIRDDLGDVLADYSDNGGNVVTMWVSDLDSPWYGTGGVMGRWRDDQYNPIEAGDLWFGNQGLGMVYDWTHPIMNGIGSMSIGYSYWYGTNALTPGSTRLADLEYGYVFLAYKDNPAGSGGLIVDISLFPTDYANSGDYMLLMSNAVKWASQQPEPTLKSMPIELDPVKHVYKDDHPDTWTPSDGIMAEVQVKDDDHCNLKPDRTPVFSDDFSTNKGWSLEWSWEIDVLGPGSSGYNGADPVLDHTPTADNRALGTEVPGIFWDYGTRSATSPVIDTTGYEVLGLEYYKHDHTDYNPFQYWYVEVLDTEGKWRELWQGYESPGANDRDWVLMEFGDEDFQEYALNNPNFQIRFRYDNGGGVFTVAGSNIDDVMLFTAEHYQGLGVGPVEVTVHNVFPWAVVPASFANVVKENTPAVFDGFTLNDPALRAKTESFWWRWNFEDGTAMTDWEETNQLIPGATGGNVFVTGVPFDFPIAFGYSYDGAFQLLYNMLSYSIGDEGTILYMDSSWFGDAGIMGMMESNLNGWAGTSYSWTYTTGCDLMDINGNPAYDVLYFGYDWAYMGSPPCTVDDIGPYVDAGGHVIVTGDEFGYGDLDFLPWEVSLQSPNFLTQFPGPCYVEWETSLCLDVSTGDWGFDYEAHNTISSYDEDEFSPVYADPSPTTLIVRVGEARYPKNQIWAVEHTYADNGIYDVDLQIIDDDMYWDFTSGYPIYTGPAGQEYNWISHNIIPVEIQNVDPVIKSIEAYVEGDLCLRLSGNKGNMAILEVFDGTTTHTLTLIRDPNAPEFGCLEDLHINLGMHANAYVKVIYVPSGDDGANPSWLVEGYWPGANPHKVKVTFNSKGGVQEQYVGWGDLLVGDVPIKFRVIAGDVGSDDLAVIWEWGDATPFGVHLYANVDPSTYVEGATDYVPRMFNQLPIRDPWFNRVCDNPLDEPCTPNDERSPWGGPIGFDDLQEHVFTEKYYYLVHVTVADDDVNDGYPSGQLNDGSDSEYIELNLW